MGKLTVWTCGLMPCRSVEAREPDDFTRDIWFVRPHGPSGSDRRRLGKALIDTQATYSFLSREFVNAVLKPLDREVITLSEAITVQTLKGTLEASQMLRLRWYGGPKHTSSNLDDFYIVDVDEGQFEVILGQKEIHSHKLVRIRSRCFGLRRKTPQPGPNSAENVQKQPETVAATEAKIDEFNRNKSSSVSTQAQQSHQQQATQDQQQGQQ